MGPCPSDSQGKQEALECLHYKDQVEHLLLDTRPK